MCKVKHLKKDVKEKLRSSNIGKVQQKIRICKKNEIPFRLGILSGLLVVVVLAAYAIYRLHRIADYRVIELFITLFRFLFNSSSGAL